jgi:SNF2 family DNA or RNA helicase
MAYTIKVTKFWGTPVFAVHAPDVRLKKVYGATFSVEHQMWYLPAFYPAYRIVLKDLNVLKIPVEFSPQALQVIQQLNRFQERIEARELPTKFKFKTDPYDHQFEGLVHAIYNFRAALFYACGLGKTKIVIDWQRAIGCYALVLCPKVVMRVWAKEAKVHGIEQEFRLIDATTPKGKSKQIADAKNYSGAVVSYDTARRYYEEIATIPYTGVVADESHYIKGPQSARTKVAIELSKKASRRIIMSGTPSLGDPRDVYSQLRFLSPCFVNEEFWKFTQLFCTTAPYNKRVVVGYKNLDVLNKRIALIALRKSKEECLDLPKQLIIDVEIPLSKRQSRAYNTMVLTEEYDQLANLLLSEGSLTEEGILDIPNAAVLINKLIQLSAGFLYKKPDLPPICDTCDRLRDCVAARIKPYTKRCEVEQESPEPLVERFKENAKLAFLTNKLREILEEPANKVIIWAQFTPELDLIDEALRGLWEQAHHEPNLREHYEPYHVRVDGRSTGHAQDLVDKFNDDPNCRVYIGQVSTGVGLTLNAANYMVYFSLPWKLGDYDQSKDRNYRLGQERDTIIYRLVGKGTVDENIAESLSIKSTVAHTITAALVCPRCAQHDTCQKAGTKLFGEDCIHQRAVVRPVTKARPLL